ncbi:AraC family transcriptional regulator [Candidatus Methylospira mobilis]|uniref:helix-turn-helix domain-containing protein n=1 Tax=Candidatus Methylospira mobilis TaxID=1808979 RepID=UPI0028EC130D|nr:AraC family transcriptional regulator [Candidatus Methylospira mobilis]WNV06585.1 AraC family transcriptional regulator [Candidatus Methylospira mobilis]
MINAPGLHERAETNDAKFDALWDMRDGKTFFTGPLYYNAGHQHGAPVFLAGIYGSFRLRMHGGDWLSCRTAVIPAGVMHELDVYGDPLTVLYIEPNIAGVHALMPLIGNTREVNGALVGGSGEISFMRELYEDRYNPQWTSEPLDDLLSFSKRRSSNEVIDPRISQVVEYLLQHGEDLSPITTLAENAGLSSSRFQHLFTEQIGVPFRRYRGWNRIRTAIREIIKGNNFTTAAHIAGFSDSAHFSHEFRKTFGAPATIGLKKLARLQP